MSRRSFIFFLGLSHAEVFGAPWKSIIIIIFWVPIDVEDDGTLCHAKIFGTQFYIK